MLIQPVCHQDIQFQNQKDIQTKTVLIKLYSILTFQFPPVHTLPKNNNKNCMQF